MSTQAELRAARTALRAGCRRVHGQLRATPAELLEETAAWCRERDVEFDVYGEGALIEDFERDVAARLGFEAARFMPSGSMAQPIALRIWCEEARCKHFGMHPSAHVELHEERGYAHLHGLRATLVGPAQSPLLAEHLAAVPERLAALLVELPIREAGGQLPSWEQLEQLKTTAAERGVRLHLDGARLWECAPAYDRALAEITRGFDSAYVSFYKGIGALPGAMLLGAREFIEQAKLWQRRQGGNLYTLTLAAATAAMRFEQQLARMPRWHERARSLGRTLAQQPGVRVLPDPPQTNLFHVFLDLDPEAALEARDRVAREHGLWLFEYAGLTERPATCRFEYTIADALLDISDDEIARGFAALFARPAP